MDLLLHDDDLSSVLFPFMELADLEAFETTSPTCLRRVRVSAPYQAMYFAPMTPRRPSCSHPNDWWRRRLRRRRATSAVKLGGQSWEQLPVALGGAALATFEEDDSIYLCGGATYGYALEGRAWLWVGGEWHLQRSRPGGARWQHTAVSVGSVVFVHGGEIDSADRFSVDSTVYCVSRTGLRSTTCRIFAQPQAAYKSAGHSCHVDSKRESLVFLFGRVDEYHCTSTVRSFSYRRRAWKTLECAGISPSPRWCHGAAATSKRGQDRIVVFGGWDMKDNLFLNDVHVLDIGESSAFTWSTLALSSSPAVGHQYIPTPRCQSPCLVLDDDDYGREGDGGSLLVFGGAASSTTTDDDPPVRDLDDAAIFDLATRQWQPLECDESLRALRGGCNAVVSHRGKRLICGGIHNADEENSLISGGFPEFLDQCLELRIMRRPDGQRSYAVTPNLLCGIPLATDYHLLNRHRDEGKYPSSPSRLRASSSGGDGEEEDDEGTSETADSPSAHPHRQPRRWRPLVEERDDAALLEQPNGADIERLRFSTARRMANAMFSQVFL